MSSGNNTVSQRNKGASVTYKDDKVDAQLRAELASLDIPPADENAKRRAIASAMVEFEAARSEAATQNADSPQGMTDWLRLTVSNIANRGRNIMSVDKRLLITGITATCVGVIAVGVTLQNQPRIDRSGDPVAIEEIVVSGRKREDADSVASIESDLSSSSTASQAVRNSQAGERAAPQEQHRLAEAQSKSNANRVGIVSRDEAAMGPPVAKRAATAQLAADYIAPAPGYQEVGRDSFAAFEQNGVELVSESPVSTFSVDVDTASYSFVRRQLNHGVLPMGDAVRAEELINYFDYDYPLPRDEEQPFAPSVAVSDAPWAEGRKLIHIGIKGYDITPTKKPRTNLVFLLDVSGSMNSPDKLPLVKQSMELLLTSLDPDDTVAIAVYAGAAGTVLEPTTVKDKQKIINAMNQLSAGGSTAGAQGIRLAYELAEAQFDPEAVNRVILATDGDFNVGIANQRELQSFIERKRDKGVFLSVLGFGQGNYQDSLMQTLAQNGNGVAAYIDT
ncbi:MAG: Ca-activated chloride channel family protein, partial [Halioglobus sp.]